MQRITQSRQSRTHSRNATGTENRSIDPAPDTIAFACMSWDVFSDAISLLPEIGKALRWKRLSTTLLTYVVGKMRGQNEIFLKHAALAPVFSPDRCEANGIRQVANAVNSLEWDMAASLCPALWIKRGHMKKGSEKEYIDTEYRQGMIRPIIEAIKEEVVKADLYSLAPEPRGRKLEAIIRAILTKHGCQPVTLEQREAQKREEQQSDPKRKKKGAKHTTTAPGGDRDDDGPEDNDDSDDSDEPAEERTTLDDVERELDDLAARLFDTSIKWMNLGGSSDRLKEKTQAIFDQNFLRLESAVARSNAPRIFTKDAGQVRHFGKQAREHAFTCSREPVNNHTDREKTPAGAAADYVQNDLADTGRDEKSSPLETPAREEERPAMIKHRKVYGIKSSEPEFVQISDEGPLSAILDTCESDRLFLCGTLEEMTRQYVEEPIGKGWDFARQYIHKFRSPVYKSGEREISVKLISESWLPGCADIENATGAWYALSEEWKSTTGLPLLSTPSKSGQALLWESLPKDEEYPPLSDDLAQLIRATSPQHRLETFQPKYTGPQHCYDGRWMYASLASLDRLPVGEPQQVREFQPYQPGWFNVRVTVPQDWQHIGLLPFPITTDGTKRWIYPSSPGEQFEVWASEPELTIAISAGWSVEVIEGWQFKRGRPLGSWSHKLTDLREQLRQLDQYAAAAVREVLNHTIGTLHVNTYEREAVVTHNEWRALIEQHGYAKVQTFEKCEDGNRRVVYPARHQDKLSIYMPHWSAQIWALERARIAQHALKCEQPSLIEIRGDAIYADRELPFTDNGNLGQIRFQGVSNRG